MAAEAASARSCCRGSNRTDHGTKLAMKLIRLSIAAQSCLALPHFTIVHVIDLIVYKLCVF